MSKGTPRVRNSCDACAWRRVKCDGKDPCFDCNRRNVPCTRIRPRHKRGPKGPRQSTAERIESHQEALIRRGPSSPTSPTSSGSPGAEPRSTFSDSLSYENVPEIYHAHLRFCRRELPTVWPIIDTQEIASRLSADPDDWQVRALAASLCAATYAQLRLDHRHDCGIDSNPADFAKETIRIRLQHDYQEHATLDSLLTSFFLHIYYSNYQKLQTATYQLREMVTTLHLLRLHEQESYHRLSPVEYQRRLRIFWIFFVTERTFCVQNYLVPVLNPIEIFPSSELEDPELASAIAGLCELSRLFIFLEPRFVESEFPSRLLSSADADSVRIPQIQDQLYQEVTFPGISETQHVDLNMTRNWLRAIIWRYSMTHFVHPSQSGCSAQFSLDVATDALSMLSRVRSKESILAHGYGMELKLARLANSVLDIVIALPMLKDHLAVGGYRDVLYGIEGFLKTVGGTNSVFAANIREKLQSLDLTTRVPQELDFPTPAYTIDAMSIPDEQYEPQSDFYSTRIIEEVPSDAEIKFEGPMDHFIHSLPN